MKTDVVLQDIVNTPGGVLKCFESESVSVQKRVTGAVSGQLILDKMEKISPES